MRALLKFKILKLFYYIFIPFMVRLHHAEAKFIQFNFIPHKNAEASTHNNLVI